MAVCIGQCPMTNENVSLHKLTDKQVKSFCDKGCSVECEKIFKERWRNDQRRVCQSD
jgi:hypothetical protein